MLHGVKVYLRTCECSAGSRIPRRRSVRRLAICENCKTIRWHNTSTFEEKRTLEFSEGEAHSL